MVAVGIIGGGQLARMTAQAARSMAVDVVILADSKADSGVKFASHVALDLADLIARSDVITFENEFCDLQKLAKFENEGVKFLPSLTSLALLVDKYKQRSFLARNSLPTPEFNLITDYLSISNFPLVMKICRQGYDGKGTQFVYDLEQLKSYWDNLGNPPAIIETIIPFQKELAVMVARSFDGSISLFPIVETQQINQVCRRVIAPARISPQVETTIATIATKIVNELNYIGILGIEFFLTTDEQILVNEMAPRPHNSAHYTIEGCFTSQFSQLIRAVLGLPLAPTTMTTPVAIMVNLLGLEITNCAYNDRLFQLQQLPNSYVHWYDKQSRSGRKLGHVTSLVDNYDQGQEKIIQIEKIWYQ